jgi:hypothetical protein
MTCGYIYKIEFPNGKHYIGLTTTSLKRRQGQHKRAAKNEDPRCLYKALRKYDMIDTFELIKIDTAETLEELCELEIEYIQEYNSYYLNEKGYNMTFGGEGFVGYIRTEEDNRKNSERVKKHYEENPDRAKEQGERHKEYWKTTGLRQKMSETKKKFHKENPNAGKAHGERMKEYYEKNPEERVKCSERSKKQFESPEAIRKYLDTQGKNKPFDIFTIDGTFIKTFCYQFEAKQYLQQEYHIEKNIKICDVLSGNRNNSVGFVFTYK